MRLLLVEDEPKIARLITRALEAQGHQVFHTGNLESARQLLIETAPDLLLLDVQLPDHPDSGFILAREARTAGFVGPILFMTARDALEDRVRGLDQGGDDYLVKPFDLPELLARVRALVRRVSQVKTSIIQKGPLELDLTQRTVRWEGVVVELSAREYALLERFALSPARTYSTEELFDLIWGEGAGGVGVVKVYVHYLRYKLGLEVVRTVSGGYRFGLEEP